MREEVSVFNFRKYQSDKWRWSLNHEGIYTVNSTYSFLQVCDEGEADRALKLIWAALVPSNVKVFAWRLMLDRLQSRQQLLRRGVLHAHDDVSCDFCHVEVETTAHLMSSCPLLRGFWDVCSAWLVIPNVSLVSPCDHLLNFPCHGRTQSQKMGEIVVWLAVVWSILPHRNEIIFGSVEFDKEALVDVIQFRSWHWIRHKMKGVGFSFFE
ncbi:uncharacterized protein LOC130737058 [Lotus japonicus]|uniref:uncharacterized protein LOC130737058 n=1 Tax=Lotus japonicus TaxID=34305 RepID=UPI0025857487|nr:uncharacterized protein LOC130737058 [Lotus japonicus]